jgi:hypothetical protein
MAAINFFGGEELAESASSPTAQVRPEAVFLQTRILILVNLKQARWAHDLRADIGKGTA